MADESCIIIVQKAILLDCVREEMQIEANQRPKKCPFWTSVLELVELVLRPPKGGPPDLPNETDAVIYHSYSHNQV